LFLAAVPKEAIQDASQEGEARRASALQIEGQEVKQTRKFTRAGLRASIISWAIIMALIQAVQALVRHFERTPSDVAITAGIFNLHLRSFGRTGLPPFRTLRKCLNRLSHSRGAYGVKY
jgi:hypothetical protein